MGVGSQTTFALTWGQPPFVTFSDTFSVAASHFQWKRDKVTGVRKGGLQNLLGLRLVERR